MPSYRFSSALASAAVVLGVALVPGSAHADDPAPTDVFTTSGLTAALSAAQASTAAAAKAGWIVQGTASDAGAPAVAVKAIYAVDRALTSADDAGTVVEAQHSGTYSTVDGLEAYMPKARVRRALKAIAKPHATWVFTPRKKLDLSDPEGDSVIVLAAPDAALRQLIDPAQTKLTGTPTRAVAEDGSTTYSFSATDLTADGESFTGTLTVDAGGTLTAVTSATRSDTIALTYGYGTQQVTLPARNKTVTSEQLIQGFALADLPRQVRSTARLVAKMASRQHSATVGSINSAARRLTKSLNRALGLKVFATTTIARGARITGTNRYTHARTSYTVTIAGKKAVVHRA